MDNQIPYLAEWLRLAKSGDFEKASELYFDKLFEVVIDSFSERFQNLLPKGGILFSILGFSPEPIILTAKAMAPQTHIIFTTNSKTEGNEYLDKYLGTSYEIVYLSDESFVSIYKALKEQLILHPSSKIALDITGGKKSMVASASIFGKDYGCTIVYVDFKDYLKDLRKPIPGSELLNVVYDPMQHQPELFLK
jgi:hypothetical protein